MGNVISRAKLIIGAVYLINKTLDTLDKRLKQSPGLPIANPSLPFWTVPKHRIADIKQSLPDHADIVVVGSGITAASFVYNALETNSSIRVVVLEAREICSGATARYVHTLVRKLLTSHSNAETVVISTHRYGKTG